MGHLSLFELLRGRGFSADAPNGSGATPLDLLEQHREAEREEQRQRELGKMAKQERRRKKIEDSYHSTAVGAFCDAHSLSAATAEALWKKKYFEVDDDFLAISEEVLKKMRLGKAEREELIEALQRHADELIVGYSVAKAAALAQRSSLVLWGRLRGLVVVFLGLLVLYGFFKYLETSPSAAMKWKKR
eukprot:GHVU01179384.1.p1 GENE.GHVU01179384.1~~GHVU01179384.1.p1  ORF type:complete len:188 (+),score=55.92 GHVU01179384.1:1655-2218(+)